MQLPTLIASAAVLMGVLLVSGYAIGEAGSGVTGERVVTAQSKVEAREVQRRTALDEHRKRKEDFAKRCGSQPMSRAQLEECRLAYRNL